MATHLLFIHPAKFILETIGKTLWGFKPNLMRHFVDQHGAVKSIAWFAGNMPKYEKILKEWGPIRTHLIATAVSTINGCPYCTHGHAQAFQLHFLKENEALFPLDENAMFDLHKLSPAEVVDRLAGVLMEVNLGDEVEPLQRTLELYNDQSLAQTMGEQADEDQNLLQLINMFATLNECGIQSNAEIDQVHDPINRDMALRDRYAALRAA